MRKVYSLALFQPRGSSWESAAFYYNHLPGLLRGFYSCFPGWELWIHHDVSLYNQPNGDTLIRLAAAGKLKLLYCGDVEESCRGMLWRMRPIWEGADIVACRDVDGMPYPRDCKAVERWITSDRSVIHVIHDSESHSGIMGGTTTFRADVVRGDYQSWTDLLEKSGVKFHTHGSDQILLNRLFASWESTICSRPQRDDMRDRIGPHIGACFPSSQLSTFYDEHYPNPDIRKAEVAFDGTKILMGCDQHPQYVGGLPLTALMWREITGGRAAICLVGDPDEWLRNPRMKFICDKAREVGADLYWIGRGEGHRDATWAQVGRLYATLIDGLAKGSDFFITADADMWPLSRDFFANRQRGCVSLWYANAYGGQKYPLCYVGATLDQWRKVMALDNKPFRTMLQERLDENLGRNVQDSMTAWCFDEVHFATCLAGNLKTPDAVKLHKIDRHGAPPRDRIDRSAWPEKPDVAGKVDAHLVRPPEVKYAQVRPILEQLLSPDHIRWADDYVRDLTRP